MPSVAAFFPPIGPAVPRARTASTPFSAAIIVHERAGFRDRMRRARSRPNVASKDQRKRQDSARIKSAPEPLPEGCWRRYGRPPPRAQRAARERKTRRIGGQDLDISNRDGAIERIVGEFTDVGDLTRSIADRFEAVFRTYRAELQRVADVAPTLADAARDVTAVLEAAAAGFSGAFPNQPTTDCAAGCAFCCHLAVAVPPGVAEMMRDHVDETFAPEARSALLIRLQAAEAVAFGATDPATLRHRCPLLSEDSRCTVYPVRPISCRAFTSPSAKRCEALLAGRGTEGGIPQNASLFRLHRDATAVLEQTARLRGVPAIQRGLAAALLDAMGRPVEGPASA